MRGCGILMLLLALTACRPPSPPPNILLYVVDTLRADGLEPYGNPVVSTPAAARLAREGMLYERAYAHSSWTRPSIASLLTGQFPHVHGVEMRMHSAPKSLRFVAEVLSEAGYTTGAIVTNPNVGRFFGFDQGYGDFIELFAARDEGVVQSGRSRAGSDVVTKRAIEWIDRAAPPFFLFVLTSDPHSPYEPPAEFDRFEAKADLRPKGARYRPLFWTQRDLSRYYGEVAFNDDSFGRLLDHLRKTSLYDETLIVLTADHGEEFGEHGHQWHGKTLFDEQVRVPLIIRRPGEPQPGRRIVTPVQLIDLHTTLLDAAGVPRPPDSSGQRLPPDGTDSALPVYSRLELDGYSAEMLVAHPWKWITSRTQPKKEKRELGGLFNLESDPFETRDLQGDRPEIAAKLQAQLVELRREHPEGLETGGPVDVKGELPREVREALEVLGYLEREQAAPEAD